MSDQWDQATNYREANKALAVEYRSALDRLRLHVEHIGPAVTCRGVTVVAPVRVPLNVKADRDRRINDLAKSVGMAASEVRAAFDQLRCALSRIGRPSDVTGPAHVPPAPPTNRDRFTAIAQSFGMTADEVREAWAQRVHLE